MNEILYKQIEEIVKETENTVTRVVKMLENSIVEFEKNKEKIRGLRQCIK